MAGVQLVRDCIVSAAFALCACCMRPTNEIADYKTRHLSAVKRHSLIMNVLTCHNAGADAISFRHSSGVGDSPDLS